MKYKNEERVFYSISFSVSMDDEPFKVISLPARMGIPCRGDIICAYISEYGNKYNKYKVHQIAYALDDKEELMEVLIRTVLVE